MISRHILHVFKKDGVELLRDRRTIFVNVLLPVLLFPLIFLFVIQVAQITRGQKKETPQIATIALPYGLNDRLTQQRADGDDQREGLKPAKPAKAETAKSPPALKIANLSEENVALLKQEAQEIKRLRADTADEIQAKEAKLRAAHALMLGLMRKLGLAAVIIAEEESVDQPLSQRLTMIEDDANADIDDARSAIKHALEEYRNDVVAQSLRAAGMTSQVLTPVPVEVLSVAPIAESLRSRLAGIIPMFLVVMAVSGAFYPALDLVAGERERGTLESLLSWPVRRRDIFLGKLMVTCVAAVISVVLNLTSGMLTVSLAGAQLGAANSTLVSVFSAGAGVLAACFLALLPLTVTLATVSLSLAGLAASVKEAQNYLTPLIIVVSVAAGVAAMPGTRPNYALDLIPITGPVLALKESLRAANVPWTHLLLSTAASSALAVIIVGWAVKLLEDERFCYPGLVRAGWGRFRKWGKTPGTPNALEAMAVFTVALGSFLILGISKSLGGMPILVELMLPLLLCVLLPSLVHTWLGNYSPQETLSLRRPSADGIIRALFAIPLACVVSSAIGTLSGQLIPKDVGTEMQESFSRINALSTPMLLLATAVIPGICEELLCRGTLLSGLRRSLGGKTAVIVSAFLFAAFHLSPYRFLPQFVLAIFLGFLVLRTGSIVPAILLHVGHNAAVVLLGDSNPEAGGPEVSPFALVLAALLACLGLTVLVSGRRDPTAAPSPA